MILTLTIFYTQVGVTANLFDARRNSNSINFGNSQHVSVEMTGDSEYIEKYCNDGDDRRQRGYGYFLVDCIKYNFRISSINGEVCIPKLNPYTQSFPTKAETVVIEIEEV